MELKRFIYKHNKFLIVIFDLLLLSFSFLVLAWIKPDTIKIIIPSYTIPFLVLSALWLLTSLLLGKYDLVHIKQPVHLFIAISTITFIILSTVSIFHFALKLNMFSRIIVFGTIVLCYIFELITFRIIYEWLKKFGINLIDQKAQIKRKRISELLPKIEESKSFNSTKSFQESTRKKLITENAGPGVYDYFAEHLNIESDSILIADTTSKLNIITSHGEHLPAIINLKKVNHLKNLNDFFEAINHKLCDSGIFIGCMETRHQRNQRISCNKSFFTKQLLIALDEIAYLLLVIGLWFRNVIFKIPGGQRTFVSKAEVLGRLVSCGFEIIEHKEINNLTFFVVTKAQEPSYSGESTYGILYKMPRIGQNHEIIYVYKFRTMHPYSEYLQDYVIKLNGYSLIGKPAEDFRLTRWGKIMRKYWLDEIPQIINVLRGEMNLVGIRPLSRKAFNDYPEDIKSKRVKYKPGCIPPYVSLLKQGMSESIEAERIYLEEKEKKSLATDIKYFKLAILNIITNKIRSA